MTATHHAAILPQKGGPLSVELRDTPEPGPNEVLIEVKAVAVNIVDCYQRDISMPPVLIYPAVLGSDAAGIVVKVGSKVTTAPAPGSRVLAFASSFSQNGSPDHGAFQKFVLVQAEAVIALPDALSFEEGAVFPMGVLTALTAWATVGVPLDTKYTPEDKQAVLIWGGASSVGSFAVQSAKSLGFTVYVTASPHHHELLKRLGADAVFDYKDENVVSQIVAAVKRDGVNLHTAHAVVFGALQPTLDVLKETKGDAVAKVAHSPPLPADHPTLDNTEITFNFLPLEPAARTKNLYHPNIQVESGGLHGLNEALDKLKAGVSGTKIVVPI
ncbi:putative zinc binding dehydrogenase [Mycena metata]|uniref:Zinc binding dehydrogenase n=1 Tax=Mycena metata TaxID=1033252 RepID=A0AAD7NWN2_9AGAR|nr:putative zinc binding dehydrogenase [Mycena metata]